MAHVQRETQEAVARLNPKTVAHQAHHYGLDNDEPLSVCMDALLRYAKAYRARYESALSDDYVLGPCWLSAIKGVRGLLNGQGAVAMEHDRSTDSKDNGTLETVFWAALEVAGFSEEDI